MAFVEATAETHRGFRVQVGRSPWRLSRARGIADLTNNGIPQGRSGAGGGDRLSADELVVEAAATRAPPGGGVSPASASTVVQRNLQTDTDVLDGFLAETGLLLEPP